MSRGTSSRNSSRGVALVELAAGLSLCTGLLLMALNAAALIFSNSVLDEATRDAARAAAQVGIPEGSSPAQATQLANEAANTAIKRHDPGSGNPLLKNLHLVGSVDYQPYANIPLPSGQLVSSTNGTGASTSPNLMNPVPYVTVTVSIDAMLPAPFLFFGQKFNKGGNSMTFEQTLTFPIVAQTINAASGVFDPQQMSPGFYTPTALPCPLQCPCLGTGSGPPGPTSAPPAG